MSESYDRVVVRGNYGTKDRMTDGVKTRVVTPKKATPSTQHIGKLLTTPTRPDLRGEDPEAKKRRETNRMDNLAQKSRLRANHRGAGWRTTPGGLAM